MKKILNTTRARQVLTRSFAAALIAKGGFLSTASAEEMIIDFKGGKITEAAISKRLQEENENKIRAYTQLTKKFEQCTEDFQKPLQTLRKPSNDETLKNLVEEFIAVVPGGEALGKAKRNTPSQNNYVLFPPKDTSEDAFEAWREIKMQFATALSILEAWANDETYKSDAAMENARKALWEAGIAFYKTIFGSSGGYIMSNFKDPKNSEEFEKECRERLKATKEAQAKELVLNITLKNGTVDSKTSGPLFKNLNKGLYLTFDCIKGTLSADEVLKKHLIELAFLNSELELKARCFQKSPFLERLIFKNSTVTMGYLCFADCNHLQSPKYENLLLYLPFLSNLTNIFENDFENDPCRNKEFIRKMATDCFRERCKRGAFEKEQDAKDYLMINELDSVLTEFYNRCKTERRNAELEKQFEVFKKTQKQLESRNGDLERAKENQRNEMEALLQKYRTVKTELKTTEGKLSLEADKFSQLFAEYERFRKQQTETVENLTKELEGTKNTHDLTKKQLRKSLDTNKELREKLKNLQSENETQKEEIEILEALKEEWKGKIDAVAILEEGKSKLEKQLIDTAKERDEARRMLDKEREKNKTTVKEKNKDITELKKNLGNLRSELTKTQTLLFEAQRKIKELQTSESYVLNTMDVIREDEEEPKEEVKNDDFRSNFQKNTFQQKQNTNKKRSYPNKKGKKSKTYVEYNGKFEYEN